VGNASETLNLMKGWLQMLQPTTGINESFVTKIENSFTLSYQAISNIGNQWMLISDSMTPRSTDLKLLMLTFLLLILSVIFTFKVLKNKLQNERNYLAIFWILISSYLLFASIFGGRLGSHHFILMVPLLYIVLGVCVGYLTNFFSVQRYSFISLFLSAVLVGSLSLMQGSFLFERLRVTGGVGLSTNALSNLAIDARQDPSKSIYIFPDWGFFMPFAFQTQNLIEYSLDSSLNNIEKFLMQGRVAKVAFWSPESLNAYKEVLSASELKLTFEVIEYFRNDGVPAFQLLQVSLKEK